MRIRLLIQNAYVGGGTARTTMSTAGALAARGHEVEIVSLFRRRARPTFPPDPRVTITPLVDEWAFKRAQASATPAQRARQAWRTWAAAQPTRLGHPQDIRAVEWNLYSDLVLARWLRSVRDGVLVGTRPALNLVMARFARASVVRVAQDHMNLGSYRKALRAQIRRRYAGFDAVVTLTERDAWQYSHLLRDRTRVLAIPNGVPDLGGRRAALEAPVVVTAGRLVTQKGFDRLLPVWARVAAQRPGWRLEIYGAGGQEENLREQLGELGLDGRARLMGRSAQLFDRMAQASLFVMTSRKEGLPMVLLEAMGLGLPVLSYDCPTGPREVITDGVDGYVVPNGNEAALEARMLELIDDPEARKRLGAGAVRKAARYDVQYLAERWERLFGELLEAKARRRR